MQASHHYKFEVFSTPVIFYQYRMCINNILVQCHARLHITLRDDISWGQFSSDLDEILDSKAQNIFVLDNEARFWSFNLCCVVSSQMSWEIGKFCTKLQRFRLITWNWYRIKKWAYMGWKVCFPPSHPFLNHPKILKNAPTAKIFVHTGKILKCRISFCCREQGKNPNDTFDIFFNFKCSQVHIELKIFDLKKYFF